ncbi:MAG: glycosyltransferase family 2 protein [Mariniblastus sp.]|nr:glycosyltransferase family 2 protein [Mariniblastus sp.]
MPLKTPIAFCIFNRPALTAKVFESIRKVAPERLLVIGDGPRAGNREDELRVRQSRAVLERIDWKCKLETNLSDKNLGCKSRMASGLTWAFEQSEELIILEDDCQPDPTFFSFCEQLLERYRHDDRVMMISGNNFQPKSPHDSDPAQQQAAESYYFSRWPHIWGWASWRRAWNHFDVNIESWPQTKQRGQLKDLFRSDEEYQHWASLFDQVHAGKIDTWDFSWAYAFWRNKGLSILPTSNLISNLGFGPSATHTVDVNSKLANLKTERIETIIHPDHVEPNLAADLYTWENIISPPSPTREIHNRPKWYRRLFGRSKPTSVPQSI